MTDSTTSLYLHRADAITALQRYNGATLDSMPMRIELVAAPLNPGASVLSSGRIVGAPVKGGAAPGGQGRGVPSRTVTLGSPGGLFGRATGGMRGGRGDAGRGRAGGRGRGRAGGRGGRGRGEATPRSAADLDKELESYKEATMQE